MPYKTSQIEYTIKLYNSAGTYQRVLSEVTGEISIQKSLYGGSGPLTLRLSSSIEDLESDITFNAKIKIYRRDAYNTTPQLVYYGYIVSIDPIKTPEMDITSITCLGAISKLNNDFLRQTSGYLGSPLAYEIEMEDVDGHVRDILEHYRERINDTYASYSYSMIDDPADYWADTDYIEDTSSIGTIPYRYFNLKHLGAIREITKFLPKNDSADNFWYWYLGDDGRFRLKKLSSTADHTFQIRKHITYLDAKKNIEGVVNKVFFWNEEGAEGEQVLLVEDDATSQSNYDIVADRITDSQIYFKDAAELYTEARLKESKDYSAEATIRISADSYDVCSVNLGDTVSIRDIQDNDVFPERMVVRNLILTQNELTIELSTPKPDLAKQVEADREYVEQQLKWFGNILTRIDGTRIHSGVQHWTQEGITIAPSNNDTIEWTEGTFYLPNDVRRVISSGSVQMSEDTILFVDEESVWSTKDVGKSAETSGNSGSIKAGENFLVDEGVSWDSDQYKGYVLWVDPDGGDEEKHIISRNTEKVIYIEAHDPFDTTDAACPYEVHKLMLRNIPSAKRSKSSTASTGCTVSTIKDLNLSGVNDFWNGYEIKITSGDNASLVRKIDDYDSSSHVLTMNKDLPSACSQGDKYEMYLSPENQVYLFKAKPTTNASSEAQVVTDISSLTDSIKRDAPNILTEKSITGDLVVDGTLTATQINTSGINIGEWGGDLDDVGDGSTYKRTTTNEKTGAGRAYEGLNSSYQITKGFVNSDLNSDALPTNGVRIDSNGIYGRKSGSTTFYINSSGDAYFSGSIGAATLTGTLKSDDSPNQRVEIEQNLQKFYSSSGETGAIYGDESGGTPFLYVGATGASGELYLSCPSGGKIVFAQGTTLKSYIDAVGDIHIGTGNATFDNSSNTSELRINKNYVPSSDNSFTLGSSGLKWSDIRGVDMTLTGDLSVSGNITVSGNVDGVDVSAHDGGVVSSYHTINNLIPANATYDLGSSGTSWQNLYVSNIPVDVDVHSLVPESNDTYNLGSSTYSWQTIYTYEIDRASDNVFDFDSSDITVYKHLVVNSTAANLNIGSASLYWNEINYKYLTDRGCLGWFEDGVELQSGERVTDVEALKRIKKHPELETGYGVPRLDYASMPKAVYKPAPIAKKDIKDKKGKIRWKKGEKMGEDGAELTSLISIMLGAIKELETRLQKLEAK